MSAVQEFGELYKRWYSTASDSEDKDELGDQVERAWALLSWEDRFRADQYRGLCTWSPPRRDTDSILLPVAPRVRYEDKRWLRLNWSAETGVFKALWKNEPIQGVVGAGVFFGLVGGECVLKFDRLPDMATADELLRAGFGISVPKGLIKQVA